MPNNVLNNFLNLPATLKRKLVFHAEGISFGIRWVDRLMRTFESNRAIVSINYPVTVYLESTPYAGELEVRRDGTHAIRLNH